MRSHLIICALLALLLCSLALSQEIAAGQLLLEDDFSAFAPERWGLRQPLKDGKPVPVITARDGTVQIGYSSGNNPHDPGVYAAGFTVADAVVSLTVGPTAMPGRAHTATLSYRAADPQAAAGGMMPGAYHVELAGDWSGSRDVVLRYGSESLAAADLAASRDSKASLKLQVAFVGDLHRVSVDGKQVIEYWESAPGRAVAGHVGFGGYYSVGSFDDFSVRAAQLATGPAAARPPDAPLLFQGRPFFVNGTFDPPSEADTQEWLDAGGNTAIVTCLTEATPEARRQRLLDLAAWAERHHVAMIYAPAFFLFSRQGDKVIPTLPAEIPEKVKLYQEMLAITASHPWTLGYWTFDEPENQLYKSYGDYEKKKDQGLAEWIAEKMKWSYDTLKAADPDAYVMPTIAWWTTYEGLAPLYDVNVPNTYTWSADAAPLTGPLYHMLYDTRLAVDAVRATGRTGVVFMPGIFDNLAGARAASRPELRYGYFAPLTQGAVGLLPWRLGRCSMPFRRAVIYPVMREAKALQPWLLGEVLAGKVSSDHDRGTAEYLRKLPLRIKEVAGEETDETRTVDTVPDCSYILRRRPTGGLLLRAVSNRSEPMQVTFTLKGLPNLPETAREALDWASVPIREGQITDTFAPFGVKAYLIEPK